MFYDVDRSMKYCSIQGENGEAEVERTPLF